MGESKNKIDSVQCLRAIAALMVFISHLGEFFPGAPSGWGGVAVSLFMVMSGYLIGLSKIGRVPDNQRLGYYLGNGFQYALSKAKKFCGIYYLMLIPAIFSTIVGQELYSLSAFADYQFFPKLILNILFLQSFVPNSLYGLSFNWPTWYLSTSMFFYFCTPLIILGVQKIKSRKKAVTVLAAVCAMKMFVSYLASPYPKEPYDSFYYWLYLCPLNRIMDFICGIMLACLMSGTVKRKEKKSRNLALVVEILTLIYFVVHISVPSFRIPNLSYGAECLPLSLLMIYTFAANNGAIVQMVAKCKPLVSFGNISMEFFIVHRMVLVYVNKVKEVFLSKFTDVNGVAINLILVALSFVICLVGSVIWIKVISPMLVRARQKPGKKTV